MSLIGKCTKYMPPKRSDEALQLIGGWGFLRLRPGHVKSAFSSVEASSIPNLRGESRQTWHCLLMDLIPPPSLVAVAHSLRISKGGGRNGIYKSTFPFLFFAYIVSKVHITGSSPKPVKLSGRAGLKARFMRLDPISHVFFFSVFKRRPTAC